MHPSQNHRPTLTEVAAMSDSEIRAYKAYYTRLLFLRALLLMSVMGMGALGPSHGVWGVVSALCSVASIFVGLPFGLAFGWSYRFDQHLTSIGKGPWQ